MFGSTLHWLSTFGCSAANRKLTLCVPVWITALQNPASVCPLEHALSVCVCYWAYLCMYSYDLFLSTVSVTKGAKSWIHVFFNSPCSECVAVWHWQDRSVCILPTERLTTHMLRFLQCHHHASSDIILCLPFVWGLPSVIVVKVTVIHYCVVFMMLDALKLKEQFCGVGILCLFSIRLYQGLLLRWKRQSFLHFC